MIFKIIGGIGIIIICYLIGETINGKMESRLEILRELQKVGYLYKACVRHTGQDLIEILKDIRKRVDGCIEIFIADFLIQIEERKSMCVKEAWEDAVNKSFKEVGMSKSELNTIYRFGEILGYLDKKLQIEHVELYLYEIDENIKSLKNEIKEKSRLYKTLSIAIGLFIVIILI